MLGADAVVLFTALGGDTEAGMIDILSAVGRECAALGMPFIAEAEFPTTYATVEELKQQYGFEYLRRNVRLCAELGADIVKTNWPGDAESFGKLVEAANGIPVVLAGGSRLEDDELLCADGAGRRGRRDRLLGGAEHLHARLARGDHPRALPRDPRAVERREGARRARRGARTVRTPTVRRARSRRDEGRVHDRRERGRGPRDRGARARPARRDPAGRGVRDLRHGRADVLQRRPAGARAVGARPRAGRRARGGRARGRAPARRRQGRPRVPRLDPHVRRVPVVHGGVPEPVRAPPAVRVRPVPRAPTPSGRRCRRSRRRT